MMYVDTSVLVALCVREPKSEAAANWYESCEDELISGVWCVTEFASALSLKRRTGQISEEQSASAWQDFERLCATDLQLTPIEPPVFHQAAVLSLDTSIGLRAGDALHLAIALDCKAHAMVTLDAALARAASMKSIDSIDI
ncbi:tRNA(fMet)-specific endonuclease VapC [Caballeronia arvi]|uniref:tRNA(fMet)-specific endonuclease VapC n=1 Tax=Caballeronia arvi TaxID=1777135 RepID=A0A158FI31_9BURK|nr:type II toxin-antitoxin system VapC family toxin [Caballeronia arvi]SAL19464.1 tRNA(fMet)-specific endonuclease VapC [Caballeronia arvi]